MRKKLEKYVFKSLKEFCTFKIGGNAKWLFVVHSIRQLKQSVAWCIQNNTKFKVIGLGANLLFDDAGFDGAIIVNKAKSTFVFNKQLSATSGTTIAELINLTKQKSLSGLEHFAGIPSTLGGALTNNLGAWGQDIASLVVWIKGFFVYQNNTLPHVQNNKIKPQKVKFKTVKLKQNECNFEYRNSMFKAKQNFIITKAKLKLKRKNKAEIQAKITETLNKKSATQPVDKPSVGSIFKRTHIIPSKLIDECGLKGKTVGNAQVSPKHAGFIVNLGGATSDDVKNLIKQVENEIFIKYSAVLEPEIEFVEK